MVRAFFIAVVCGMLVGCLGAESTQLVRGSLPDPIKPARQCHFTQDIDPTYCGEVKPFILK